MKAYEALEKIVTKAAPGAACTVCLYPCWGFTRPMRLPTDSPFIASICPECGHIMIIEGGRLRNMTRAERRQLPGHPRAWLIRQAQDDATKRLIG